MKSTALTLLLAALICECGLFRTGEQIEFCDLYVDGECKEPMPELRTYTVRGMPPSKKESWFALDHYLYFHSRETPGLRVDFAGLPDGKRAVELEGSLECRFTLIRGGDRVSGIMKGRRIDPDGGGFWCFDYLGSMLDHFHKDYGMSQQRPDPAFFPVELELAYRSSIGGVQGKKRATIRVEW